MIKSVKNAAAVAMVSLIAFSFTVMEKEKKVVKVDASKVVWKGYKVAGSHEGTLTLESGNLYFENDKLIGGDFVMDMTSLTVTDLSGDSKASLEGHLKSDDFFGIDKYKSSKLVFKTVKSTGKNSYKVTADLTIKNKTNPVSFDFSVYGSKASAAVKIDRTKFDVRYGSSSFFDNLKDKAIYDEFDLVVDLQF